MAQQSLLADASIVRLKNFAYIGIVLVRRSYVWVELHMLSRTYGLRISDSAKHHKFETMENDDWKVSA